MYNPPLHALGVDVSATPHRTESQVFLIFHLIVTDTTLFILIKFHSVNLIALSFVFFLPSPFVVLLEFGFCSCSDPTMGVDFVAIHSFSDKVISTFKNLLDFSVEIASLPYERITWVNAKYFSECKQKVRTMFLA